jgi:hypothetical protein
MTTMMMTPNNEQQQAELLNAAIPADDKIPSIPDRMYFRIGDVAEIAGVQPYVLRFWEKEFDFLVPIKNSAGQRLTVKATWNPCS